MAIPSKSQALSRALVSQGHYGALFFEGASRRVPPDLAPYVFDIQGYIERTPAPLARHEFPGPKVVIILEFGPPISLIEGGAPRSFTSGFVAGIDDGPSLTRHLGHQAGMQIDLNPLGARLLFGIPMVELSGVVVGMGDILGREAGSIIQRLGEAGSWDERFDEVEAFLRQRIHSADLDLGVMPWAMNAVLQVGGALDVKALAKELGYSHKHVIHLFKQHIGVTPRALARVVRFDALIQRLKAGEPGSWADLAYELGFYDQAHLIREAKSLGGLAPRALFGQLTGAGIDQSTEGAG